MARSHRDKQTIWPRIGLAAFAIAMLAFGCAASPSRRAPDPAAIREASQGDDEAPYASSRGYAHYVQGMLAANRGDHRAAVEELKLAAVFDPSTPHVRVVLAEQYVRVGAFDRAELELKQAVEREPTYSPAHVALGRLLAEQRRHQKAVQSLERAVQLSPKDPQAYMYLAQVYLEMGEEPKAVGAIEALSAALPAEPMGLKAMGQWYAERKEWERAGEFLSRSLERDPGDAEALVSMARALEGRDQLSEAAQHYERALARRPDDAEALLAAGSLCLRRSDLPGAQATFERLVSVSPEDAPTRGKIAFALVKAGRLSEAARYFSEAHALAPQDATLSFFLGRVLEELREFKHAAQAFAVIDQGSELHAQALIHQAQCLSQAKEPAQAVELLRRALAAEPDRVEIQVVFAQALEQAGRAPEAAAYLERQLKKGGSSLVFDALAGVHERAGKLKEALDVLRRGIQARPRDERLLFALGAALDRQGRFVEAVSRMREVLVVNPRHAHALNFLGYSYADRGQNLEEAELLIRRAIELAPDNAAFLDSLGWLHFKRGDYEKAVRELERAHDLLPQEAVIAEHLGDAYAGASRVQEAAAAYRRALRALEAAPDAKVRSSVERKLEQVAPRATGGVDPVTSER